MLCRSHLIGVARVAFAPTAEIQSGDERAARYGVRTATEVSLCRVPPLSVKVTKTRLIPRELAPAALPVRKMPKVGIALGEVSVATLGAGAGGGARQAPL